MLLLLLFKCKASYVFHIISELLLTHVGKNVPVFGIRGSEVHKTGSSGCKYGTSMDRQQKNTETSSKFGNTTTSDARLKVVSREPSKTASSMKRQNGES